MIENLCVLKLWWKTVFILIFFSLISFYVLPSSSSAKNYSIQSVVIDAQLNSDGSMDITEKRTYNFNGYFRWATYFLPTGNTGGVVDFSLSERGIPYLRSQSEVQGTYQFDENPESIQAKWFFDAKDEKRTFIISYKILDVVDFYMDAAVLYYQFVGSGWDKSSQEVQVNIYPPKSTNKEQVRAWAHGPLWGEIEILNEGEIIAEVQSLPPNTFWEVRAIYPPELFSQIKTVIPEKIVSEILIEEKRWADEANRKREEWLKKTETKKAQKRYGAWIVSGLSLIGFLIWLNLYKRYGKKPKVPFPETFYSEIPSDTPPALLSYMLYGGQISGTALVGTILDLARRRFLKIREEKSREKKSFWSSKKDQYFLEFNREFYTENRNDLQDFENDLLDFLFNDLSEGKDIIDFKTLSKNRRGFTTWFRQWQKAVKKMGEAKGYWEKESVKAKNKGIVISILLFSLTIVSALFIEEWVILPGISAFILLVLSLSIQRLKPEFDLEAVKWKALKKYLNKYHFREADNRFVVENVERFLVYGVVLGLSREVVKKMAEIIPAGEYSRVIPWYIYSGAHSDFSPTGFAESLSSLMSTATATMSSASGTGGGASGGGGGGAGGSGGGAG
jgi:uncharacterized membrane protein